MPDYNKFEPQEHPRRETYPSPKKYKNAIGWAIEDLKGISPTVCMHKTIMEDDHKPVVQPQRRLNLAMKEVVQKEVVKLLDACLIYPISDSH